MRPGYDPGFFVSAFHAGWINLACWPAGLDGLTMEINQAKKNPPNGGYEPKKEL